jgi:hypothetical protein
MSLALAKHGGVTTRRSFEPRHVSTTSCQYLAAILLLSFHAIVVRLLLVPIDLGSGMPTVQMRPESMILVER